MEKLGPIMEKVGSNNGFFGSNNGFFGSNNASALCSRKTESCARRLTATEISKGFIVCFIQIRLLLSQKIFSQKPMSVIELSLLGIHPSFPEKCCTG